MDAVSAEPQSQLSISLCPDKSGTFFGLNDSEILFINNILSVHFSYVCSENIHYLAGFLHVKDEVNTVNTVLQKTFFSFHHRCIAECKNVLILAPLSGLRHRYTLRNALELSDLVIC